jgi:hypothetical protein
VAGWCRAPLFSTFWDEIWIRGLSPRPDISPAYAFTQEDAPYLPTTDPYAHLSGGLSKGIQCPVGGLGFILGMHHAIAFGDQSASRWLLGDHSDDLGAFLLSYSRSAPSSGTISKFIYPFGALKRWRRLLTVCGWQPSSSAILAVRTPCQLKEMMRALAIQSPGAWRLRASLRILYSSSAFWGARARSSYGIVSLLPPSAVWPRVYVYRI